MSFQSASESFLLPPPQSDYSDLSVPFSKVLRMYGRSQPHHDRTLSGLESITTEMSDDESIDFTTTSSQETLSAASTLVSDTSYDSVASPGSSSAFSLFISKSSQNGSVASSRGNGINLDHIDFFEDDNVDRCYRYRRNEECEPNATPVVESCFHRFIRFVYCRAPEADNNDD